MSNSGAQPPPPPSDEPVVTLDSITQEQTGDSALLVREIPRTRLGRDVFLWLLGLVFLELSLLSIYAVWTYPRLGDITRIAVGQNADLQKAWLDARSAWVTSLKDLGQIFLLTPVFPLIGAVIGYMFGRQEDLGTGAGPGPSA
jgi:hypothetical protein